MRIRQIPVCASRACVCVCVRVHVYAWERDHARAFAYACACVWCASANAGFITTRLGPMCIRSAADSNVAHRSRGGACGRPRCVCSWPPPSTCPRSQMRWQGPGACTLRADTMQRIMRQGMEHARMRRIRATGSCACCSRLLPVSREVHN